MYAKLMKAAKFATIKHARQAPRGPKSVPYVSHCFDVAERLLNAHVESLAAITAAILHDTLEDTETTYDELVLNFGKPVADIVQELTLPVDCLAYPDGAARERAERQAERERAIAVAVRDAVALTDAEVDEIVASLRVEWVAK